jgi:adenine deaminase
VEISGQIVDILNRRIYPGRVHVSDGKIISIEESAKAGKHYILPGFIDAHVHIESSMIVPSEFARMAVVHGTVATISDPHEIGNVLGLKGVEYMIDNGKKVPFKFYFGAPSCVPATNFETAGAEIGLADVETLLRKKEVHYLAEMMNWPGVLSGDALVMSKIALAKKYNKVIDGHAPGVKGDLARKYASAGMTTDHECFTAEEALDKLAAGMKIIIREGSAAKNFEALVHLIDSHPDQMMFCSDDKHPDSLEEGHINLLVKRAVRKGLDVFNVLKAACLNPIQHYSLNVGQLRAGDAADFILVKDLKNFAVLETFIDGRNVAANGVTKIERVTPDVINNFEVNEIKPDALTILPRGKKMRVIEAMDGQLITNEKIVHPRSVDGIVDSNVSRDILKMVVVNRYQESPVSVCFVKGFGMKSGAIASSVAHDSHNVIAVGVDDHAIAEAINLVIRNKGGVSLTGGDTSMVVPLEVAGLMSTGDGYEVSRQYKAIDRKAKDLGSKLKAPFMTLSFMALLVIPSLKLSDKGLFDGNSFQFVNLFK